MKDSQKQLLLEILSSLKDIWDWAPILENNIENGNFGDKEIGEIEDFLREKAKSGKNLNEQTHIKHLQEKISRYQALEQAERIDETKEAGSTLTFFS